MQSKVTKRHYEQRTDGVVTGLQHRNQSTGLSESPRYIPFHG
jgi:hypothetical protein